MPELHRTSARLGAPSVGILFDNGTLDESVADKERDAYSP